MLCVSDEELGEICGIFAGDGTLYRTTWDIVLEVRGEPKELRYYQGTVSKLFGKLFCEELNIIRRNHVGGYTIGIRKCGNKCKIFNELGFPVGKKSRTVEIPKIILNNDASWIGYIRGIFDTDGSIYLRRVKKEIRQPVISICSMSENHLLQIQEILRKIGFNCWIERGNHVVRICGWSTIERFLRIVQPNNTKHLDRVGRLMPRLESPSGRAQNRNSVA